MAVWADFDEDDEPPSLVRSQLTTRPSRDTNSDEAVQSNGYGGVDSGPSAYVAHALRCYPVAEKLASYLDLTDLDSLSSTCRPVHESLIQFAHQLKQHSLRCAFEIGTKKQADQDEVLALQLSVEDQLGLSASSGLAFPVSLHSQPQPSFQSSLGLTGKVSRCARDLVAPCRKCGTIVCRNCIEKPPSNRLLPGRMRRLCDSCLDAPLILHKAPLHEPVKHSAPSSSASSTRSQRSDSDLSDHGEADHHHTVESVSQMPEMWLRDECTCADRGVYLCQQCGHANYSADNIYQRVWKWRSRYSTHLGGGLGTGLGLGNQGQKCGRGRRCLATRDAMALMETECAAEEASTPSAYEVSRSNTPINHDHDHEARPEPGYFRQEIEGIGGHLKSKSKKLVKVGATVYEFRDERESGKYLAREASGELRAWCSWCDRVCPDKQDREEVADENKAA
ncbi:hypothetical protein PMZ80_005474 [Knufia obscura]|uniref:Uncharacterized protein n=1 Tax=Knufia obscura TaxID=1635080 RepID=A0ABR0RRM2_9EURO|nr:hypothetical protein PMZ80_005474 [Knufia obscura]